MHLKPSPCLALAGLLVVGTAHAQTPNKPDIALLKAPSRPSSRATP